VSESGTTESAPAAGKGRPTPKRSEKERRRGGPVTPPPRTRKEAAQRQREQAKAARTKVRSAALAGDERFLPKRDAGPGRRLVRDVVDSRRNAGVLLLPSALLLVLAQISGAAAVIELALVLWLAGLLLVLLDTLVLGFAVRRTVRAQLPQERRLRGHIGYALLRSTVFRRWRMPAPLVSPGARP
jgi:hypothetical protein